MQISALMEHGGDSYEFFVRLDNVKNVEGRSIISTDWLFKEKVT